MKLKKSSADVSHDLATTAEVEAAIEALTPPQSIKLREFALMKVSKLGRKAQSYTWKDLLSDAYIDALSGNRNWNKSQVDFFGFLIGAMRSIASNRRSKFDRVEKSLGLGKEGKLLEIPLDGKNHDGKMEVLQIVSLTPNPERELLDKEQEKIDRERVQAIMRLAEERELAPFILLDLMDGKSGPEIQRSLNITKTQYETEMKWIFRNARKALQA